MDLKCVRCGEIWRAYARATEALFHLGSRLPLATLAGDALEVRQIEAGMAREHHTCDQLRELLRDHELREHAAARRRRGMEDGGAPPLERGEAS